MGDCTFLSTPNELTVLSEKGSLKSKVGKTRHIANNETISPRYITIKDAATYLSLTVSSVRNMICRGTLPRYKLGRRVLLKKAEIDRLVESSRKGGLP